MRKRKQKSKALSILLTHNIGHKDKKGSFKRESGTQQHDEFIFNTGGPV